MAVLVEAYPRLPQQQRVEQFARGLPAAAPALRQRLLAIVALAHDLHRGRRGLHFQAARRHHRVEQLPAVVRQQFEQRLVDRDDRDFGALVEHPTVGTCDLDGDRGPLPHLVHRLFRRHLHLEAMRTPANLDLGHAHAKRGLAQVDQRRRPRLGDTAPDRQHRYKNVRRVRSPQRDLHHRRLAGEWRHEGIDHAPALDGHQRHGIAEGRAHLQHRLLSRFVVPAFRDHVHAIVVGDIEPPLAVAGDPGLGHGHRNIARVVKCMSAQDQIARLRHRGFAGDETGGVAAAFAEVADAPHFRPVFVGIKAADQALAMGVLHALEQVDPHRHIRQRNTPGVQGHHLQLDLVLRQGPAIGLDAEHDSGRPQRDPRRPRQDLAVRIVVFEFGNQIAGQRRRRQIADDHAGRTAAVERDVLRALRTGGGRRTSRLLAFLRFRGFAPAAGRLLDNAFAHIATAETKAVVARERDTARLQHRPHLHPLIAGTATGQVGKLHADLRFGGRDQRTRRARHLGTQRRHAKLLDPEGARPRAFDIGFVALFLACRRQRDAVSAGLRVLRDRERRFGNSRGRVPAQRKVPLLAVAVMAHHRARRKRCGVDHPEARYRVTPNDVLHADRVAGPHQRAIEHRGR